MRKEVAVSISNISKSFVNKGSSNDEDIFWALDDISFDVYKGETLGIIGPNGAGKSTLLKILSKVISPTTGTASLRGRVSSLLEVGTGFHPELTGFENIYFNGSLLGMSRKEIEANIDDIISFADIGDYIHEPIKHYSSGMRVRLGFSIASQLDPEILIIDEALSVGDRDFQKKSIKKMNDTANSGKTVIFVSHSINSIKSICDRAAYLNKGRLIKIGETNTVIDEYVGQISKNFTTRWTKPKGKDIYIDSLPIIPTEISLTAKKKEVVKASISHSDQIYVKMKVDVRENSKNLSVGFSLFDDFNNRLFRSSPMDTFETLDIGKHELTASVPLNILKPGTYYIAFDLDKRGTGWVGDPRHHDIKIKFRLVEDEQSPNLWKLEREGLLKPSGIIWEIN
ncbi:TPA: ATP-binding cassette domain-containing protein [Candidatus Saccharibacteria bacterium]|nr:ATP-binding cassette domain-containing protein [Candidatus Saccharibacteria bacterium]